MSKYFRAIERSLEAEHRAQEQRLLRARTRAQVRTLNKELLARVDVAAIEAEIDAEQYAGFARKA